MNDTTPSDSTDTRLTRRRAITGGACLLGVSAGALHFLSDSVRAEVSMGELHVSGDNATLAQPPSEVRVTVTGEWSVQASATPEQCRTVLQIHTADGTADDLAESIFFEQTSGAYELTTNLYDHRALDRGDMFPDTAGESASYDLLVRVILLLVRNGEIQSEVFVEDTATLELTKEGLELAVGGSGEVVVSE